jgi:hypothetical protein
MSPIAQGPGTAAKYRNGSARSRSSVRIRSRRRRGLLARPAAAGRWDGLGVRDQAGCFSVAACDTCLASVCGLCWRRGGAILRATLVARADGQPGLAAVLAVVISPGCVGSTAGPEERRDPAAGCRAACDAGRAGGPAHKEAGPMASARRRDRPAPGTSGAAVARGAAGAVAPVHVITWSDSNCDALRTRRDASLPIIYR